MIKAIPSPLFLHELNLSSLLLGFLEYTIMTNSERKKKNNKKVQALKSEAKHQKNIISPLWTRYNYTNEKLLYKLWYGPKDMRILQGLQWGEWMLQHGNIQVKKKMVKQLAIAENRASSYCMTVTETAPIQHTKSRQMWERSCQYRPFFVYCHVTALCIS